VVLVSADGALGDAEWVATQTEHFAASAALECWCAADTIADQNVSNTNSNAIHLEIERKACSPTNPICESISKTEE
jgi:hypothetical protein